MMLWRNPWVVQHQLRPKDEDVYTKLDTTTTTYRVRMYKVCTLSQFGGDGLEQLFGSSSKTTSTIYTLWQYTFLPSSSSTIGNTYLEVV